MPTAYVTVPQSGAESFARELVEERLAACVNRVPCTSVYRWDGEINYDDEEILLIKTTDERYEELVEHVQDRHPYEVPCIERFDEADANAAFVDWRRRSVRPPEDRS